MQKSQLNGSLRDKRALCRWPLTSCWSLTPVGSRLRGGSMIIYPPLPLPQKIYYFGFSFFFFFNKNLYQGKREKREGEMLRLICEEQGWLHGGGSAATPPYKDVWIFSAWLPPSGSVSHSVSPAFPHFFLSLFLLLSPLAFCLAFVLLFYASLWIAWVLRASLSIWRLLIC